MDKATKARPRSSARTDNAFVNEFLAELDARISDEDPRHSEAGKEKMRRLKPAILLFAQNEPDACEDFIRRFLAVHYPAALKP
jgi:hypothetical protein